MKKGGTYIHTSAFGRLPQKTAETDIYNSPFGRNTKKRNKTKPWGGLDPTRTNHHRPE